MYRIHITYKNLKDAYVTTDHASIARDFHTAFSRNPEVSEMTLTKREGGDYRRMPCTELFAGLIQV